MLSKKHFIRITDILNKIRTETKEKFVSNDIPMINKNELVYELCNYFEEDNPLFDRSKFIEAVNKG